MILLYIYDVIQLKQSDSIKTKQNKKLSPHSIKDQLNSFELLCLIMWKDNEETNTLEAPVRGLLRRAKTKPEISDQNQADIQVMSEIRL